MWTLNPRDSYLTCSWHAEDKTRNWALEWVGDCGIAPTKVPGLPTTLESVPKQHIVTNQVPALCSKDGKTVETIYEGWTGCGGNTSEGDIEWDSFRSFSYQDPTLDCSWTTDGQEPDWKELYSGECGVPPTLFPNMPSAADELP